ncbi:hypothetical protein IJ118_03025 [Candidatus Saccharibacteria bacterium]|nr:hypothetical protein [Candidatus Saccharibacteria bacterium]
MYNQGEIETKERRKVVLFAAATAAVILALIVAIVVVATNKANRNAEVSTTDKASFSIEESGEKSEGDKNESTVGTVSTKASTATTAKPATTTTATATDLPSTGPEDLLPLAVSLGGLTTAASAFIVKRRG